MVAADKRSILRTVGRFSAYILLGLILVAIALVLGVSTSEEQRRIGGKWVQLSVYTALIFGGAIWWQDVSRREFKSWLVWALCLLIHLGAWSILTIRISQFQTAWSIPLVVGEYIALKWALRSAREDRNWWPNSDSREG